MKRQTITAAIFLVPIIIGVWGCGGKKSNIPKIDMIFVKGGTFFTMGCTPEQGDDCEDDEKPHHSVTVGDFYISKYEVTQKLWEQVMGTGYYDSSGRYWGFHHSPVKGDDLPVTKTSWHDILGFINELNAMTGKQYRFPTEAEWEYAARGGKKSKGYKYSGSNHIDKVAWYYENSGDEVLDEKNWDYHKLKSNNNRPHPVGTKSPNELGIYDMSGNVWEWVNDKYDNYTAEPKANPQGPSTYTNTNVLRGGGWASGAGFCRVSNRGGNEAFFGESNLGFRLALDP